MTVTPFAQTCFD